MKIHVAEERSGLLARVHILKQQIQMSDDNYRFLLSEYFQAASAADLSVDQLRQFISSLEAYGNVQGRLSKQDWLILRIWDQLFQEGKTGSGSRESLNRWIYRQTKVQLLEWLNTKQKAKVIEALKQWLLRPQKLS